ncbi:MAG: trypsin-like serine protease [Bradyrhizobium sp.]|uniref:trypsin-like serine protease n=1 Tax=Bradyrhizobium sp. TaxID=376 RepID=UPI003D1382B3
MRKCFRLLGIVLLIICSGGFALADDADRARNDDKVADLEAEISYRVIGGDPADEGAWPWQVALYSLNARGEYSSICGGSLIDKSWVLTAAHCLRTTDAKNYRIVEGASRIDRILRSNGKGRALAIERVIPHETYDGKRIQNDIALLKLASSARSQPVVLAFPEGGPLEEVGRTSIITGWGAVRPYDPETWTDPNTHEKLKPWDPRYFLDRLQQADLPIIDCKQAPKAWHSSMDRRNLCTYIHDETRSSCQGDSGGPLVAKREDGSFAQIGVVSYGGSPCNRNPSVFSRVSAFKDWIEAKSGLRLGDQTTPKPVPTPAPRPPAPKPPGPNADRDNPAGVEVGFVQGQRVKVGQNAQFRVTTRRPGYLVLLDVTPDRKITQIFPNARSLSTPTGGRTKSNYVDATHPLLVPDRRNPYEGFDFTVEEPAGEGRLIAILSDKPLKSVTTSDLPKSMLGTDAVDFLAELTGELRQDLELRKSAGWSFAVGKYEIVP